MSTTNCESAVASFLVAVAIFSGCAADRARAMNESLDRSPAQLATLESEAAAGRCDSAYQIAQYYDLVVFDEVLGRRWLERAAALHWRPAVGSLGNELVESSSAKDRRRGRALLVEARKLPEV